MPKDFVRFFSRIEGRKCHSLANLVEFRVKKVIFCLYHSGSIRQSTVKKVIVDGIQVLQTVYVCIKNLSLYMYLL